MAILALPPSNAGPDIQLDWLELSAFFDEFNKARMDELTAGRRTLEEEQSDDFSEFDQNDEAFRAEIEKELDLRQKHLGASYPFEMSRDGEEIAMVAPVDSTNACFYLLCLIASHITRSPILNAPPNGELLERFRNRIYQIMGTLAVAGRVNGPAVSVGYPRQTKESILEVLRRAEVWGLGLSPRTLPGADAAPRAKDGGIDVIGWTQGHRAPPFTIVFAQLASGVNWTDKPASIEYENFMDDFFVARRGNQHSFLTLIPFRIPDELFWIRESKVHKHICDRCSAPKHAFDGVILANGGINVDEIGNVGQLTAWISDYRACTLAA